MLNGLENRLPYFYGHECSFTTLPQWGREKQRLSMCFWVWGFFSDYHLSFEGNNVGLSSGNIALTVRTATGALLQDAPCWDPFAGRLSPYNSALPATGRLCQDMTRHGGGGWWSRTDSSKRGREWSSSRQSPISWVLISTPNLSLQASHSLRRCPSASAPDTSIYVPVSALLFFPYGSNFNILLLLPHEKNPCLPSAVPFILLWTNWSYSGNNPLLDFGFSPL